jgi:UDPglucose--hexose-1-phosphate uridylyltransferase
MPDSQIRPNKATNQWVIFAPARGERPRDFVRKRTRRDPLPEYDDDCPFCPERQVA